MKCENLKAYLDGELGRFGRLTMRAHLRACADCRESAAAWLNLSRKIQRLEEEPVPPALADRVVADAQASARVRQTAPVPTHSKLRGVMTMKRAVLASVFVITLITAGVLLYPRQKHNVALADVAQAMANVQSAHLVGWTLDRATGKQLQMEAWVKGTSKLRFLQEGSSDLEVADNGEMTITLRNYNGVLTAWIEAPKHVPGFKNGMPYLDMFIGGEGLTSMLETSAFMAESVASGRLSNGGAATIITLRHMEGGKAVLVVDADSNLLTEWKIYDRNGSPVKGVDSIEYNIEIPDSTFTITIPKGTPVIDYLTPESPEIVAAHKAEQEKLKAEGWEPLSNFPHGMCGTPYHEGLNFQSLDNNGLALFYSRGRNVYHVVGRALVLMIPGDGSFQVVENAEVPAPGKPAYRRLEDFLAAKVNPRVEAAEKELRSAGGELVLKISDGGGSCGSLYHSKLRFQVLRNDGCVIVYFPERNTYAVFGKVRVFGMGLDQVVEDGEIKAPGPPEPQEEQPD